MSLVVVADISTICAAVIITVKVENSAQVVETSVTDINSHFQDYTHPDNQTQPTLMHQSIPAVPIPPRANPRALAFFFKNGKFPGVGTSKSDKCPGVGPK